MNSPQSNGYAFYKDTLKSPKYVVAPMVDQSELAWRLLARELGADLCFTPMFSSTCVVQNRSYRAKVLQDISSCHEDHPLIVQFCANVADVLVEAGKFVQEHCEGIDLNLGCPQHIARRGHFGAYLQDEWELIFDMISACRTSLHVGVSAKIRIFPEVSQSIDYARMLERAGCHFLTVHGRTRDQKGPSTGLASWSQIRAIKECLSIPVFANGNIQHKADIERCLSQTGADAVMVAETHLSNPAIFQGHYPDVMAMADKYLGYVERYPCSLTNVRTHMFKLWCHCLLIHKDMREKFGMAQSITEIAKLNREMADLCRTDAENGVDEVATEVPHWKCQPYVRPSRVVVDGGAEMAAIEQIDVNYEDPAENHSKKQSKNQIRRMLRYEKKIESKRLKRNREHERRRLRDRELARQLDGRDMIEKQPTNRNKLNQLRDARVEAAMRHDSQSLVVCVDLSWSDSMNEKEIGKLACQLGRFYGSNRKSDTPAHVYFAGLSRESLLWRECVQKHDGFENYKITMSPLECTELFELDRIVYLTPDANEPLENVETGRVYVLGGLVDETVTKQLTLNRASDAGLTVRRLPVKEYMHRTGTHRNYSTVYPINQVFDILLSFNSTRCWRTALDAGVPRRKGYVLNSNHSYST